MWYEAKKAQGIMEFRQHTSHLRVAKGIYWARPYLSAAACTCTLRVA
jgi:hypothetical protein